MSKKITVPSPNNPLVNDVEDSKKQLATYREDVANKLVRRSPDDMGTSYKVDSHTLNQYHLSKIATSIAAEIRDNRTIMELLPDTKAIFNLMISTIKSPNTLIGTSLRWEKITKPEGVEWEGNPEEVLRTWLEDVYNIDTKLTEILWNVLCWRGSHPILTLPSTTLDELINGKDMLAGESFNAVSKTLPFNIEGELNSINNIGILDAATATHGNTVKKVNSIKSLLAKAFEATTLITDNCEILKRPAMVKERQQQVVLLAGETYYNGGNISGKHPDAKAPITVGKDGFIAENDVFRKRRYGNNPLLELRDTVPDNKSLGHGLYMDLSSESVIPIGDFAYLVMLADGKPIKLDEHTSEYDALKKGIDLSSQDSLGGNIINSARTAYSGSFADGRKGQGTTIESLVEDYGAIFDKTVKDALTDSKLTNGQEVNLPDMDTVHLMGLIRALRGSKTTLLVVPTHLMTYWSFEKDQYGVGISLLSKNKYLASQRITIRLAELMAKITNSVPRKEVLMHIDDDEEEPEQMAEMMRTSCIDNLRSEYSIGAIDTRDIITNFVRANTTIRPVHKSLPDHHLEVKDYTRSMPEPDRDLTESLKSDWYKALDTQPELVDEYYKPNFAVEYVTKSIMQTKTTIEKQKALEPHLNSMIKQMCYNLPQLNRKLLDCIVIKKDSTYTEEEILEYIIETLKVTFPRPEQAETEATVEGLESATKFIRLAVEAYINDDMLSRLANGNIVNEDVVKAIQGAIIALCQREWLQGGSLDILRNLTKSPDEDGTPAIDIAALLETHSVNILNNLGDYAKTIVEESVKRDSEVTKVKSDLEERIRALEEEAKAKAEEEARLEEEANNPPATEDDTVADDTPPEPTDSEPEPAPAPTEEPAEDTDKVEEEPAPTDEAPAEPAEPEAPATDEDGGGEKEPWM